VEKLALRRERLGQVRRRAVGTEGDGVILVLQQDHEHVLDRRQAGGGAGAGVAHAHEPHRTGEGQRGDQQTAYHAMTATLSPAPTVAPASTRISEIVPARSALMWFSIFIASRTHTVCPTSTRSPTATHTLTIVPCLVTVTLCELAAPPPDC